MPPALVQDRVTAREVSRIRRGDHETRSATRNLTRQGLLQFELVPLERGALIPSQVVARLVVVHSRPQRVYTGGRQVTLNISHETRGAQPHVQSCLPRRELLFGRV